MLKQTQNNIIESLDVLEFRPYFIMLTIVQNDLIVNAYTYEKGVRALI